MGDGRGKAIGTGHPLTLRCAKCKARPNCRAARSVKLEATGQTKPRAKWSQGGVRQAQQFIEYRCLDCGHIGWSGHSDAERLLKALGTR